MKIDLLRLIILLLIIQVATTRALHAQSQNEPEGSGPVIEKYLLKWGTKTQAQLDWEAAEAARVKAEAEAKKEAEEAEVFAREHQKDGSKKQVDTKEEWERERERSNPGPRKHPVTRTASPPIDTKEEAERDRMGQKDAEKKLPGGDTKQQVPHPEQIDTKEEDEREAMVRKAIEKKLALQQTPAAGPAESESINSTPGSSTSTPQKEPAPVKNPEPVKIATKKKPSKQPVKKKK